MIDLETTILFIAPPLPGVGANDRAVGRASGEVASLIASGEVSDGVVITHKKAIWILGTLRTSIIVN